MVELINQLTPYSPIVNMVVGAVCFVLILKVLYS